MVAHRGAAGHVPENTLEAFAAAIVAGAPIIELDVHLGADGSLIVVHDATLSDTHGTSIPTADMTAGACVRHPVKPGLFGFTGWPHLKLPTLDDVFCELGHAPTVWLVEAKYPSGASAADLDAVGDAIVGCVNKWGMADRVIVQSFSQRPGLRAIAGGLPACYIDTDGSVDPVPLAAAGFDFYGMRKDAPQSAVDAAIVAGLRVKAYTINRHVERDAALARGVVGVVTDHPGYMAPGWVPSTRDPFVAGAWPVGHLPSPVVPVDGVLSGGGLELAPPDLATGVSDNYTAVTVGSMSPVASPSSFTLSLGVRILEATTTSRSAQVQLCATDVGYHDNDHGRVDAYNVLLRANGRLDMYKAQGSASLLASAQGPALTVGASGTLVPLEIEVSPTKVIARRTDVSGVVAETTDTSFRPPYIGLGVRSARARFTGLSVA